MFDQLLNHTKVFVLYVPWEKIVNQVEKKNQLLVLQFPSYSCMIHPFMTILYFTCCHHVLSSIFLEQFSSWKYSSFLPLPTFP